MSPVQEVSATESRLGLPVSVVIAGTLAFTRWGRWTLSKNRESRLRPRTSISWRRLFTPGIIEIGAFLFEFCIGNQCKWESCATTARLLLSVACDDAKAALFQSDPNIINILMEFPNDSASFLLEKLKIHVISTKNPNIWPKIQKIP